MIKHKVTSIIEKRREEQKAQRQARIEEQAIRFLRSSIATTTSYTDKQALEIPDLFPSWDEVLQSGKELIANTCIIKDGVVYRVVQNVTPQSHQAPDSEGMLAIYRPIQPSHAGTLEDPIPWVYGMDCEAGQYFSYNDHIYCVASGGDMIPCVWEPGTAGLWQWQLVE